MTVMLALSVSSFCQTSTACWLLLYMLNLAASQQLHLRDHHLGGHVLESNLSMHNRHSPWLAAAGAVCKSRCAAQRVPRSSPWQCRSPATGRSMVCQSKNTFNTAMPAIWYKPKLLQSCFSIMSVRLDSLQLGTVSRPDYSAFEKLHFSQVNLQRSPCQGRRRICPPGAPCTAPWSCP